METAKGEKKLDLQIFTSRSKTGKVKNGNVTISGTGQKHERIRKREWRYSFAADLNITHKNILYGIHNITQNRNTTKEKRCKNQKV